MRRLLIVALAALLALPFGWAMGVLAAYVIAGPDFGQLPIATVPLGMLASIIFVFSPISRLEMRVVVMAVGTSGFLLLGFALN